ncbi:MAG TPA: hypothetical protein VM680_08075 [Verrucomicrobiae bacterium]|nr:hypothetical protein [Verrucomicrobiae bacterium]
MKLIRDLKEFIELLNSRRVEYVLVGGWAFGFHATPRYTGEIDFFLKCDAINAARLKEALQAFGFEDLPEFEDTFLQPDRILQFGVPPNRIDILTQISGVTFADAWSSRVHGEIDGLQVPIISRECLLRNKSAAGRPKDIADADALKKTAQ